MRLPLRRSHRSRSSGQLLLFDLLDRLTPDDASAGPPGTSLTPVDAGDEPGHDGPALLNPDLWAAFCPPAPGPTKSFRATRAPASADQVGESDAPTFELITTGDLNDAQPSTQDELESIVSSPVIEVARLRPTDEPGAEDHVCTPADFVVGPVARFEANLAALALLKTLAAEGRPATPEERAPWWTRVSGSLLSALV